MRDQVKFVTFHHLDFYIDITFDLERSYSFGPYTMSCIENYVNRQDYKPLITLSFNSIIPMFKTHQFFTWVNSLKFISMHVETCDRLILSFPYLCDIRYADLRPSDKIIFSKNRNTLIHISNNFGIRFSHSKSMIV